MPRTDISVRRFCQAFGRCLARRLSLHPPDHRRDRHPPHPLHRSAQSRTRTRLRCHRHQPHPPQRLVDPHPTPTNPHHPPGQTQPRTRRIAELGNKVPHGTATRRARRPAGGRCQRLGRRPLQLYYNVRRSADASATTIPNTPRRYAINSSAASGPHSAAGSHPTAHRPAPQRERPRRRGRPAQPTAAAAVDRPDQRLARPPRHAADPARQRAWIHSVPPLPRCHGPAATPLQPASNQAIASLRHGGRQRRRQPRRHEANAHDADVAATTRDSGDHRGDRHAARRRNRRHPVTGAARTGNPAGRDRRWSTHAAQRNMSPITATDRRDQWAYTPMLYHTAIEHPAGNPNRRRQAAWVAAGGQA